MNEIYKTHGFDYPVTLFDQTEDFTTPQGKTYDNVVKGNVTIDKCMDKTVGEECLLFCNYKRGYRGLPMRTTCMADTFEYKISNKASDEY